MNTLAFVLQIKTWRYNICNVTALLFTVGVESIVLAYNRIQNNGEMLFLGQAVMMLQSEPPAITSLEKKERQNLL
jgi:hypothetical protein